ncbi:CMGC/MAPK protein kinase [Saprolegnia parasitica CBS 223.65]|uniref:Mitogen-activated protein kinase n=1 Tax=Saprolegnia parasitica (strain CBS 223.65) TaxID=695850 RepID=A0A067CWF5_SAPPC|nr:CMGC/MAPK protein kinase [Saprolegnia parasitica CBS 223.65]KDO34828.1 CMGC/MAPK protein kinase [Saprolegnia parasitica CBS 223.65]|eukprot:XP_012194492.1 CMGC/MAPK protein kinase [Saprolegnia parasitica CBS 223.65]
MQHADRPVRRGSLLSQSSHRSSRRDDDVVGSFVSDSGSYARSSRRHPSQRAVAMPGQAAATGHLQTQQILANSGRASTYRNSTTASVLNTTTRSVQSGVAISTMLSLAAGVEDLGNVQEVHWEGHVRKKGDWLPRWEPRYLVLDGTTLTYYSKQHDARSGKNLRGRMVLTYVGPDFKSKKAHGFMIETKGHKRFHLCCATELEKDMWVEMMQTALDEASSASTKPPPPQDDFMSSPSYDLSRSGPVVPKSATRSGYSPASSITHTTSLASPVNVRDFYDAMRQLLLTHSSSAQFFPKLSRDVSITSNYAPSVPFWGEYHGLDGVLHFFSILYETVAFTSFFVTDVAQTQEGSTAIVVGRETMRNKTNHRKFTQQWTHTIEFSKNGRVKHIHIAADPVAASAVFGCNATSSLSLPIAAVLGAAHSDTPPGRIHVHLVRGDQIGGVHDFEEDLCTNDSLLETPGAKYIVDVSVMADAGGYLPTALLKATHHVQTGRSKDSSSSTEPEWDAHLVVPFGGATHGKPCCVVVQLFKDRRRRRSSNAPSMANDGMELIGLAKVNLAPFLALAKTDDGYSTMPQWYTLLAPGDTKFAVGRLELSLFFEEASDLLDAESDYMVSPCTEASYHSDTSSNVSINRHKAYRDRARNNVSFNVGNTAFDIPKRYQMIKAVGQGAYGCVIAASDTETGQSLAIKNVPNAFNDLVDAKRILREIRLMRHLNHPYLVNLVDLIRPSSLREFNDVYIVTDLMETDLHRVINSNQSITDDHIQYFLYQMLVAIKYVHSADVLHRDLKPSNILVNSDCDVKLCDFGLARGIYDLPPDAALTEYVVTRWYRAPEVLLTSAYDKPMDVWAIGCILAEMIGRRPLFPGSDFLHQLKIILDVVGTPTDEAQMAFITNHRAKRFILKQPKKAPVPLTSLYPRASPLCLDLLAKMLVFNPRERITPSVEQTCVNGPFDFAFEDAELTKDALQELMFEDVCAFHPEVLDKSLRRAATTV